jgi:hypothetical protein
MRTSEQALKARTFWISGLLGFIFGGFFANAVPHLTYGLMGLQLNSPFGVEPGTNVYWGLANLAVAAAAVFPAAARRDNGAFSVSAGVGALGTAVSLLVLWAPK